MSQVDIEYGKLLRKLLDAPVREDRTGTGTHGIFGHQMRFDLEQEFPLITTKRVFWKGVVEELLWFISGSTNNNDLVERGVHIWDEWADQEGNLGPIYSHQWRQWGAVSANRPQPPAQLRRGVTPAYLGVGSGAGKQDHPLGKTWEGMMARCYDKNSPSYRHYGRRGVFVCDRWLEFTAFAEDAVGLPGWDAKQKSEDVRYVLDKDQRGSGFEYSPSACQWVTDADNSALKEDRVYTLEKDGEQFKFTNVRRFAEEQGIDARNLSSLWTRDDVGHRYGFKFVSLEQVRPGIDQLDQLVEGLVENPFSRRHIISAWNPSDLPLMALPPCHALFQMYVDNQDRLSCQLYQRSADAFLGLPFNIASYALLTHMLAHVTGLKVGELVWTGGDVHLYLNHVDQAREQLERDPLPAPTLRLNDAVYRIDGFDGGDIELIDYVSHPSIKAAVAV